MLSAWADDINLQFKFKNGVLPELTLVGVDVFAPAVLVGLAGIAGAPGG
jgi:hypothetical protein